MTDKVSILIPVYNTEASLPRCLDSCIGQTYGDLEVIVIIDGSTDNSSSVARSYAERDSRIKVIVKENEGLPLTRRRGFEASTGSFIFHLDSDDYIEPNTIEALINRLKRDNADIVIGGTIYEKKNGNSVTSWISKIEEKGQAGYLKGIFKSEIQPNIWGRLIRRRIFEPVRVPRQYNCGEDYLANIMMICYNPGIKIITEDALLYHYIVYAESLTNTWPAEVFMPYTDEIARILSEKGLEDQVMNEWAWYRVIKSWIYYLRRGGKLYLKNKTFVINFYEKYFMHIKYRLSFLEKLELNLYRYSRESGYLLSKIINKCEVILHRQ